MGMLKANNMLQSLNNSERKGKYPASKDTSPAQYVACNSSQRDGHLYIDLMV